MRTSCDSVNFARRTSCLQCNKPRADDAPPADIGFEAGLTHVLFARSRDENADEEMLRYEFSKHAPIKDLRLVRDRFTHVSRGFAFVHFHSVDDATNGTTLDKKGAVLKRRTRKEHSWPRGIRIDAVKQLLQLRQRHLDNSMMLLDGRSRNITQMKTIGLCAGASWWRDYSSKGWFSSTAWVLVGRSIWLLLRCCFRLLL